MSSFRRHSSRWSSVVIVAMLCVVTAGIVKAAQRRRAVRHLPYASVDCTAGGPCPENFTLENYDPHPSNKAPIAV